MNRLDPEYPTIWREKYRLISEDFLDRRISDDVFKAELKRLGFVGNCLSDEFRYQDALRFDIESHRSLNGRLKPL